jgi:hypothetical protein
MVAFERIQQVVIEANRDDEWWKPRGREPREQAIVFIVRGVDCRGMGR